MISRGWRAPWSKSRPIRSALFYSLIDSLTATAAFVLVEQFFIPYLRELGSTDQQVGILTCVPYLMASLSQLISPEIVARHKRRKPLCVTAVFLQVFWLLLILGLRLMPKDLTFGTALALFTLYAIFGSIQMGAWASWMADLIPDRSRSRYFGWRSQVSSLFSMPIAFLAGALLDKSTGNPLIGFTVVFSIALVLRFISAIAISIQYEPPMKEEPHSARVSFLGHVRGAGNRAALYAGLYFAGLAFATRLAWPAFVVYMLEDLDLSYKRYVILGLVASVTNGVFIHFWGYVGGKIGNAKVMKIVWPGIVAIPALWTISGNYYYLVVLQIIAGICWSAHFLAAWNYILDVSSPETRTRYVSYSMGIAGVVGAIGPLVGGLLVPHMPPMLGYSRRTIFAISAGLRLLAGLFLLGRLREVKPVAHVGTDQLIYALPGVRPMMGIYRAVTRRVGQGGNYDRTEESGE